MVNHGPMAQLLGQEITTTTITHTQYNLPQMAEGLHTTGDTSN